MKPPVGGRSERVSLNLANAHLRRGARTIPLRPKDLAVLLRLIAHHGQLVTKNALLTAAWPDVFVTDAVLKVSIRRLRAALGDDARAPRFIQTRHRLGYCLVGKIPVVSPPRPAAEPPDRAAVPGTGPIVGREVELAQLDQWFAEAAGGARRVVFITGEAGLGKTALVDCFLQSPKVQGVRVGRGQCVEQHGQGETYLPVFDALGRLCRGSGGSMVTRVLARHAPSWLAQMPGLLGPRNAEAFARRTLNVARERMIRELVEVVDVLARKAPLILVVEDLHWSDPSTLDAVAALARRREPARLFVVCTYRPEERVPQEDLLPSLQHLCGELRLPLLPESAVQAYLQARWLGARLPAEFGHAVYQRTDGHPLFLVAVADHAMAGGWLVKEGDQWVVRVGLDAMEREVPAGIRQVIEARLDRLAIPERRLAEAASVAGIEWSAASVAAAMDEPFEAVDERCAAMARRGMLLHGHGETVWPDGTAAGQYGFSHALYREVIYHQVPVARRRDAHRRVALREEAAFGQEATRIAARLAMHFAQAHDLEAAVRYRLHAARNALAVSGYREVVGHARAGLALITGVADGVERHEQELGLQLLLGMASATTQGFAAAETERAYGRARELSRDVSRAPATAPLIGLYAFHLMRGHVAAARGFAEQILQDVAAADGAAPLLWGRMALGITQMHMGELSGARASFEAALAMYDRRQRAAYASVHPLDLTTVCLVHLSWCLWAQGYPEQAAARIRAAADVADKTAHAADRACAIAFTSFLHTFRRDARRARDTADAAIRLCAEHGLHQWWAPSLITRGWGRAALGDADGGIGEMRQGIDAWRGAGAEYAAPIYLAMLGEALGRHGRADEALDVLGEALSVAQAAGDQFWEPEIHRLRGELLLEDSLRDLSSSASRRSVEEGFGALDRALALAHAQQARGLELRAAVSLCRSAARWGRHADARTRLAEIYGSFGEGRDTSDLRDARALLAGRNEAR